MFKQIKQIIITSMTMFKVNHSPPNKACNDAEHGGSVGCLFCVASSLVLCALRKVRLPTSKVDNCNEVGIQLPHRTHISRASCLNNPTERNDVLVFSVRV